MRQFEDLKYAFSFLGKFGPRSQNCCFNLRFGDQTNLSMQKSVVMFTFSALDQKYSFWAKLVQKIKIVIIN